MVPKTRRAMTPAMAYSRQTNELWWTLTFERVAFLGVGDSWVHCYAGDGDICLIYDSFFLMPHVHYE